MLEGTAAAAADEASAVARGELASPGNGASPQSAAGGERPSFVFFGVVSAIALLLDIGSKAWAEIVLLRRPPHDPAIVIIPDHLTFTLAYNKGGAWGLLQDANEPIRLPFFVLVSALAVLFIVSLYGKLAPNQTALKWGLPLVFGGALGNLSDRITRSSVIDFIDYRADWVLAMNRAVAKVVN
ncbi:MAG: signal peptidase II, partial [Pseudomonadota bacterium]